MSGIAEILHNLGYQVSGSDMSENANVARLRSKGIIIHIGHDASNVEDVAVVVKSTAVPLTNPEIIEAKKRNIPVVKRSEMLAEITQLKATIAVAGSHGKTTTTSLIGHMLEAANMHPTVINGGIINAYGTNAYLGSGEWIITEADESDGTFVRIPATIGIITNLDPEHLDYWGDFDALRDGFKTFIQNLPFYGFAVMCFDHPEVKALANTIEDRRIVSYAIDDEDADVRALNIRFSRKGAHFDVHISASANNGEVRILEDVFLPVFGKHNILNALSSIVVAVGLRFEDQTIYDALKAFAGVKRRFTYVATINGVSIIDDYAHHPIEIKATLSAARAVIDNVEGGGKVIAVVQPHRYSRLENLFIDFSEAFSDADKVYVSDVYAAGEQPIAGVDSTTLVDALRQNNVDAYHLTAVEQLPEIIENDTRQGDLMIFMGAGNVTCWANELPQKMAKSAEICVVE